MLDYAGGMFTGIAFAGMLGAAIAQGFTIPDLTNWVGHWVASPQGGAVTGTPGTTTCTLVAGSSDSVGGCTTTSTAMAVTFARSFGVVPRCLITDLTANAATNAFTVSATAITGTTVTSGHLLQWLCIGPPGSA
jgi:hypothetical protein